jgi:predicted negative regulator of RcsB-dependent stress response
MDYLRSEDEQEERLKAWLKTNGTGLIGALAIGIAGVLGWQQWQTYQANQAADAASRYQQLLELSAADFSDPAQADIYQTLIEVASGLTAEHPNTTYAAMSGMVVAGQAVEKGDLDVAVAELTRARDALEAPELVALADIRLARLEAELGQVEAALARIRAVTYPGLVGVQKEVEGDLLVQLGQPDAAREAYVQAQQALTASGLNQPAIALKLSGLPGASQ